MTKEMAMHQGACQCDAGEFDGNKVHEWECPWLMCLLGECGCDARLTGGR